MTTSNENQILMSAKVADAVLEIIEFKTALARGFKSGEANAGILRWVFVGSRAVGFIPTQWAHKLLESGEFDDLNWHSSPNIEPPVMITQYSMLPAKRRTDIKRGRLRNCGGLNGGAK